MLGGKLNRVLGIECKFLAADEISCRFSLVSLGGESIEIEFSKVTEGNWVAVLQDLPRDYPIALVLTGTGVLSKSVPINEQTVGQRSAFQLAFPGISQQDFYVQEYLSPHDALIGIVRRKLVDELLGRMERAGFSIYTLSLGAITSSVIWYQLNNYGQQIRFDGHVFNLDEMRNFLDYQTDADSQAQYQLKVGETPLAEQQLIAYGAAFQLLLHDKLTLLRADVEPLNQAFADLNFNNQLKKKGLLFLIALLVFLSISYFTNAYVTDKNASVLSSQGTRKSNVVEVHNLEKKIQEKEMLLKRLNWNGGYDYGFLMNKIGSSIPGQVQLRELSINDFKTVMEKERRPLVIKITGSVDQPLPLNNWLFELKKSNWVKSVTLQAFQRETEEENYRFMLAILLK